MRRRVPTYPRDAVLTIEEVAPPSDGLLSVKDAAKWLSVSPGTLRKLGLRRITIGRCVRYDVRDLRAFADLSGTRPPMRKIG